MKKNIWCLFGASILVLLVVLSGCQVLLPSTTYEPNPTKIHYDISYGYVVNCSGSGLYEISYLCDTPEVLAGSSEYELLYPHGYETKTMVGNEVISWNISGDDMQTYTLGVSAHVIAESFLVSDLNGADALTVQVLQETYPAVVKQYTLVQGNETTRFIDPVDPDIIAVASTVVEQAQTNNSFMVAKSLFSWLKKNIVYQTHAGDGGVQSAAVTFEKRNGDCDDLSFLYVSLCRAAGVPARFIRGYLLTTYDNGTTTATAHAWVEVFVGGGLGKNGWVPAECSCVTTSISIDVHQNFGVEDAFHLRLFVDEGSNESLTLSFSDISCVKYGLSRDVELQPFVRVDNYQELLTKKLVVTTENLRSYE